MPTDYRDIWDKTHTTRIAVKLNNNTDADILKWLSRQPSKQGAIKALIRQQIEAEENPGR